MERVDCFGYNNRTKKCSVLTETVCRNRKCSFYKTQKEYEEGRRKYPMKEKSKE